MTTVSLSTVTMRPLHLLDCAECGGPRAFEAPPCGEGHTDCPDLACTDCGSAVVVGLTDPAPDPAPSAARFRARTAVPLPTDETAARWSTLPRTA
ncbi:hypothetical protein [Motilibacter deserti]|uniref:Uncharacterized protein n=1 Tax=Motilibacter deserti TaxID=2714956 RepID=A0ABX0GSP1_9ACTN|nr:hypothetical protein [Motilibacter deserti]NHC13894.1 hypothetical protein [Motilibacter deserti]